MIGKAHTQKIESKHINLRTRIKRLMRRSLADSLTGGPSRDHTPCCRAYFWAERQRTLLMVALSLAERPPPHTAAACEAAVQEIVRGCASNDAVFRLTHDVPLCMIGQDEAGRHYAARKPAWGVAPPWRVQHALLASGTASPSPCASLRSGQTTVSSPPVQQMQGGTDAAMGPLASVGLHTLEKRSVSPAKPREGKESKEHEGRAMELWPARIARPPPQGVRLW